MLLVTGPVRGAGIGGEAVEHSEPLRLLDFGAPDIPSGAKVSHDHISLRRWWVAPGTTSQLAHSPMDAQRPY